MATSSNLSVSEHEACTVSSLGQNTYCRVLEVRVILGEANVDAQVFLGVQQDTLHWSVSTNACTVEEAP